ncbi:restriction endonuclease [Halobacterium salinarum]|uniref:restriction endonuclease n=1 Tax=Halobacterium salinarum TaxID=2242 RepID=UPI002556A80E|nr:restriction endonuclease [Halobacterium salinarum]MDL0135044.1 restriction endonuclease [Halobacterium salinarum]
MKGEQFEKAVAQWLEEEGFGTELTSQTNDRGVDVIAQKAGTRYAVQAKAYSDGNRVGSTTVQKVSGLLSRPDIDGAIVVTTSSFTSEAEEVANNRGVRLLTIDVQSPDYTHRQNGEHSNSPDTDVYGNVLPERRQSRERNLDSGFDSRTICPNCGEKILTNKQAHVEHWNDCGLPDERPTNISVSFWWDIKGEVK